MIRLIAIVVITLAALAGCGASGTSMWHPNTKDVVFTPAAAVPEPAPSIDMGEVSRQAYLITMRDNYPLFSVAELLDYAGLACAALDLYAPDYLAAAMAIQGERARLTGVMSGAVVGAVVGSAYCEHTYPYGTEGR